MDSKLPGARRFLLVVLIVVALPASARASDQVKMVESLTSGETVSDGVRYVSWTHGTDVRVLDDRSGSVASFPLPAGCGAPGALSGGFAASICDGAGIQLLDVTTGTWTAVPVAPETTALLTKGVGRVTGIGSHWLSITVETNRSFPPEHAAWVKRTTGELMAQDPGDRHEYPDLDAPDLWSPLCAPLTRTRNPDGGAPRLVAPKLIGRRALDMSGRYPVLRTCGTTKTHVITRSTTAADYTFWFSDNRVSWHEFSGSRVLGRRGEGCVYGCIRTYNALTRKYRTWRKTPGAVNLVHTRRSIFFEDEEDIVDEESYRYRIRL
ncbi:hypothetical protein OJ998_16665 [Solirubrobacter taibaiensis]|nr:hypothetical protein [Solirubrobacter taibaiensis]